ncbi:hypothetical protein NUV25_20500 [Burkholderia pseudomultivorans]|uniref:hypothetical protein n=1 Tax=Burkholderia pseudomultivorans TaxID=1207504 RepID=UPI000753A87A|nr:hypothetical protein [Burkholderia pseudomultivorans]KWI49654.1 hypothetical protein WT72_26665 [Burkholderia pseudomultivorans]MDS0860090.1 hypothetical protein [Burkholderia pseudomultivorans]
MAKAEPRSRRKARPPCDPGTVFQMVLRSTPERPKKGWPYLPWMHVVDAHLKLFGFEPGDRVFLEINHVTRQINISPDYSALAQREQPYHRHGEQEQKGEP